MTLSKPWNMDAIGPRTSPELFLLVFKNGFFYTVLRFTKSPGLPTRTPFPLWVFRKEGAFVGATCWFQLGWAGGSENPQCPNLTPRASVFKALEFLFIFLLFFMFTIVSTSDSNAHSGLRATVLTSVTASFFKNLSTARPGNSRHFQETHLEYILWHFPYKQKEEFDARACEAESFPGTTFCWEHSVPRLIRSPVCSAWHGACIRLLPGSSVHCVCCSLAATAHTQPFPDPCPRQTSVFPFIPGATSTSFLTHSFYPHQSVFPCFGRIFSATPVELLICTVIAYHLTYLFLPTDYAPLRGDT